jgi:hypothetical protein
VRFRPYGIIGGGLGILDIGPEFEIDFDAFDALPPAQQNAISACVDALGTDEPTGPQFIACGVPGTSEQQVGYRGVLTFGGGLLVSVAKHVAVGVDFRYFTQIPQDESRKFHYSRATVSIVIFR